MSTLEVADASRDRISRRGVHKFTERRDELAAAAMDTLAELGYARTSLRVIAQNSTFSHGVLHYYFADKVDLITHCVRLYKARCVQRYDGVLETSRTADELADGFARELTATLRDEAPLHRLWYDLRSQSLFEDSFRADVVAIDESLEQMIWRVVRRYAELVATERASAELGGAELVVGPTEAYAMFDGLFQHALLGQVSGRPGALEELDRRAGALLRRLVAPHP
jgi:AcrR family transcriptional regulator